MDTVSPWQAAKAAAVGYALASVAPLLVLFLLSRASKTLAALFPQRFIYQFELETDEAKLRPYSAGVRWCVGLWLGCGAGLGMSSWSAAPWGSCLVCALGTALAFAYLMKRMYASWRRLSPLPALVMSFWAAFGLAVLATA